MKTRILFVAAATLALFTSCEPEQIQETDLNTENAVVTLEEPNFDQRIEEESINFKAVKVHPDAKIAEALPTDFKAIAENQVEDRSCVTHYDYSIYYNRYAGRFRVENETICFDSDTPSNSYVSTQNGIGNYELIIPIEDDFTVADYRGMYMAYSQGTGAIRVGNVNSRGVHSVQRSYNWVDYWTHLTPLQDGMFVYYSGTYNGRINIAKVDRFGAWTGVKSYGSWRTDWSHFVHLGGNKLLTYSKSSGDLLVNQIDTDGNWTVLESTNIGAGYDQLVDLGTQKEVRDGICCYTIGQGFMAYDKDSDRLKVYVVENDSYDVTNRRTYNTTDWVFDVLAQVQGNKFIAYRNDTNQMYVGGMDELGQWYWNSGHIVNPTYHNYYRIFTMSFR